MSEVIPVDAVKSYLLNLQQRICAGLSAIDGSVFIQDQWTRPEGGGGISRVLEQGAVIEKGGVNFSEVSGASLPPSASAHRPELAGAPWQAMGVSLVIHPRNPFAPTSHMNVRFFMATPENADPVWWFGGGYDLTPYYGFDDDCVLWHQSARTALQPFGEGVHARYKTWCDEYFYLKHRKEHRGIGGVFFDDLNEGGFDRCFALMQAVGDAYLPTYSTILERRYRTPFTAAHKDFQLYRRGRYVEFNLVWDRGTLFGLQSGGRTEAILMSMPPEVRFQYNWSPSPNTEEAKLYDYYLKPKDWLSI